MPMTFATFTHTGLVRRTNEDSFFARPPVFVVADGMGGAEAGEVASAMAAQAFNYFLPQSQAAEEELTGLITRVNSTIYEHSVNPGPSGMGTTITAAVVNGERVVIAHVGDSRAWLWRGGQLRRLTEDHSLVAEMIREGQLTEAEAAGHPQRSVITRALGVDPQVQVDTNAVDLQPGDVFLLASDGLHGMVPEADIAGALAQNQDLGETARALVEAANARGGNDNITVVLFSPDGSTPAGAHAANCTAATDGGSADPASGRPPAQSAASGPGPMAPITSTPPAHHRPTRSESIRAWFSTIPGLIVSGLLIAAVVLGGAWFATRYAYFVSVEGDKVSMYQGIPYRLGPVSLSHIYRSSPVNFKDMEPYWQDRVASENVQSKSSAETMLDSIIAADREKKDDDLARLKEAEDRAKNLEKTLTVPPEGLP